MSPDTMPPGRDADGFIIVHTPPVGLPYAIGPFPPIDGLDDVIMGELQCGCTTYSMSIGFPKGIKMMVDARGREIDPAALVAVVDAIRATVYVDNSDDEEDDEPPIIH